MLFSVFDGHGGKEVANYANERFSDILQSLPQFQAKKYKEALVEAFRVFDAEVKDKDYGMDTGTTANVVYFNDTDIYCANSGDSRAVLYTGNSAYPLSFDHKPDNEQERTRIEKSDHFVEDSRVDGNLALSRAFGDFQYKTS